LCPAIPVSHQILFFCITEQKKEIIRTFERINSFCYECIGDIRKRFFNGCTERSSAPASVPPSYLQLCKERLPLLTEHRAGAGVYKIEI
jgi:hypothetical protein